MRLLTRSNAGTFELTSNLSENVSSYAILSHTWDADQNEVTFSDIQTGQGSSKAGYEKIKFCAEQATRDAIKHFWMDTCCINKADLTELSEAITSMYSWYQKAEKCYVYLSDVSCSQRGTDDNAREQQQTWEASFCASRWFTRGWTLQELLAPEIVEFYSREGNFLGTKRTLAQQIHTVSTIPLAALYGTPPSQFPPAERLRWAEKRSTKRKEDRAYCLLGLLNVFMPLIYGEGDNAFLRLEVELQRQSQLLSTPVSTRSRVFSGVYAQAGLQPVVTYVSRPDLERQLVDQLIPDSATKHHDIMRTVVVWGLGGAGKSQLVLHHVQQQRHLYENVFWLAAGQKQTLDRDYLAIHRLLFPDIHYSSAHIAAVDTIAEVCNWLRGCSGRSLWIIDSVDAIEDTTDPDYIDLHQYLPESPRLDRIITTRSSTVQDLSSTGIGIEVTGMYEEEAIVLLQNCAKLQQPEREIEEELRVIVRELGCLALAITLAGSYIRETPRLQSNIQLYLPEYRVHRKRLLGRLPRTAVTRYNASVLNTWEITLDKVEQMSPFASRLLGLLAFLHYEDIFPTLLWPVVESKPSSKMTATEASRIWSILLSPDGAELDQYAVEKSFQTLQAYSLLSWRPEQQAYSMHKLVHAWSHDRLSEPHRQALGSAALNLVSSMFQEYQDQPRVVQRLVPHAKANLALVSPLWRQRYEQVSEADQRSLDWVASLFLRLNQRSDMYHALLLLSQVKASTLGEQHPSTLRTTLSLATSLDALGQHGKAETMSRRVLEIQRVVLGEQNVATISTMIHLGLMLGEQRQYGEAEALCRRALELCKTVLGEQHFQTVTSTRALGMVLSGQGRYTEVRALYQQQLELQQKALGEQHPIVLMSRIQYAQKLAEQSQFDEAEALHQQTLDLQKAVLGERHPDTIWGMGSLARALTLQQRHSEAEVLCRQTLELQKTILGEQHPDTISGIADLAHVLNQQQRHGEAEALYRSTLELRKKVLGEQHPYTLSSMQCLALTLGKQGQYSDAESLYQQTLELRKKVLGEQHIDTLSSMRDLAFTVGNQGRYSDAEVLSRQTLEECKRELGEQHLLTQKSKEDLVYILRVQDKHEEADSLGKKATELV